MFDIVVIIVMFEIETDVVPLLFPSGAFIPDETNESVALPGISITGIVVALASFPSFTALTVSDEELNCANAPIEKAVARRKIDVRI